MRQIMTAEIGDRQFTEHVIKHRGGILDRIIALHETGWLEACEGEGLHIFFQRHAILQAQRNRDGKIVHQGAEGSAFFMHIDEDFTQATIFIFAGAQIDFVAADNRLLGITFATIRETITITHMLDPLDHFLDNLFGHGRGAGSGGHGGNGFHTFFGLVLVIGNQLAVERL